MRPGVRRVLANTVWLSADRILRILIGIVVSAWVARYLGPDAFGKLNYAAAIVALLGALATLGLDSVVVRELVKEPDARHPLLGTAFTLRLLSGALCIGGAVLYAWLARSEDPTTMLLVAIFSIGLLAYGFDVVDLWFQSRLASRYSVIAKNGAFLVVSAGRVALILAGASVVAFAWAGLLETLLASAGLVVAYRLSGERIRAWRLSLARAADLLRPGVPLMFAGLAVAVYIRIDQIMLAEMIGDASVGIYSAAVRISEGLYFIPMVIVTSLVPVIIASKSADQALFTSRMQHLYDVMVAAAVAVALPLSLLAPLVINLLYGPQYASAAPVLAIQAWACVFVFLGIASSSHLLAENLTVISLYRTLIGAAVNVALNLVLIPRHGVLGAAYASLISYGVSTFALILFSRARSAGVMMLRALLPLRLLTDRRMP